MEDYPKFWACLRTSTRNALHRHGFIRPWDATVKQLIRTPGIGPGAIRDIAAAVEKHCV